MSPAKDDERTVVKLGQPPARPAGGGLLGEHADALPVGARLHEFEVLATIGQGGFGIVYLAQDHSLDRRVAVKEYMPSSLAARGADFSVSVRSTRDAETFAAGLRSFVNEARLLARFDHPSLLKVHQFWESQGTAYMVMPFYEGITLKRQLSQSPHAPTEAQLRALLHPLLDALGTMHAAQCFHRDIAPDNILILPDQRPLLLDFGAARQVIADRTQALTVILKTGYAPIEQYGEVPEMQQGPWTDLYALGSVMQYAITGRTPPQAVARFLGDKREPLASSAAGHYSAAFLRAIDRCLAVLPKDRPQSAAELRADMGDAPAVVDATGATGPGSAWPHSQQVPIDRTAPALTQRAPNAASAQPVSAQLASVQAGSVAAASAQFATTAPSATRAGLTPTTNLATSASVAAAAPATATLPRPAPAVVARAAWRPLWWVIGALAACLGLLLVGYGWLGWRDTPAPEPSRGTTGVVPAAPVVLDTPVVRPTPTEAAIAPPAMPATAPASAEPTAAPRASPAVAPVVAPEVAPVVPPVVAPSAAPPAPAASVQARVKPPPARPVPVPPSAAAAPRKAEPIPSSRLRNSRCDDIIQRVSLGEDITYAEKLILSRECKQ
jgi:serine/threonine protein kinase